MPNRYGHPEWNPARPTVPVDRDGNFVSFPTYDGKWVEERDFPARMRLVGHERGRSAFHFILENVATGVRYPMFGTDMVALLQGAGIQNGETDEIWWQFCKKGANYAVKWKP